MRTYKELKIPAIIERCIDTVSCDLCLTRAKRSCCWEETENSSNCVTVKQTVDAWKSNGGSLGGQEISFDICPSCFAKVLIPFLEEKGCKPEVQTWPAD